MPKTDMLDSGTYEIIQNRLNEQRVNLSSKLSKLNQDRKDIFSSNALELIANQRITTENNCVARGIIAFGETCLFAYNVHFGLREDIHLSDVFSQYRFVDNQFEAQELTLIQDENFITDFTNLYKYYRDAIFSKFYRTDNYLYMIFQTSKKTEDKKAFKWLVKNNQLTYIDDRSIHEVKNAPQHDFVWKKTTLEDRRLGLHPHISILDKVFIEAIGGDITFKIEDNTDTGKGIYSEPVLNKDQQLDDAEYFFADLGNLIAIKIKPYQENFRAFLFNVRTKEVLPIDQLLDAGILLPNNQGLIFPNGYYLQNGENKVFDLDINDIDFIRSISSPNGEDFLYIFYQQHTNTYILLSYNVILQQVETPMICNGFTIFEDGKLIFFRTENDAIRHHQVQIWKTPYTITLVENKEKSELLLYKIGNKDIVKAMAECQEVVQLLLKKDSYEGLYEDIHKQCTDILDSYFWLKEDKNDIASTLSQIKDIANTAIDEFAKVQQQRKYACHELETKKNEIHDLSIKVRNRSFSSLDQIVHMLTYTRKMQGAVIDLMNIKYMDEEEVEILKNTLQEYNSLLSNETVDFLLREEALLPYEEKVQLQKSAVKDVNKTIDAQPILSAIGDISLDLEMLIDILNSLKIEDTTQSTKIIEKISLLFSSLNEIKADLNRKIHALKIKESTGEFYAQMTLLEQSIVNFLDMSDTIEKCDDYLSKITILLEELESKFADFDEFISKIVDKRDDVLKAFNGKKEMLIDQMNKRVGSLEQIGLRILKNIENRASSFTQNEEIYSFFSSDLMVDKVRSLSEELRKLGDVTKAEHLETALKLSLENALRNLKDKSELFTDGKNIIALGEYKFLVNQQSLSLTIVRKDNQLYYHILGTSFYRKIDSSVLNEYASIWDQELLSETKDIYRSLFLAYQAFCESARYEFEFDWKKFIQEKTEKEYQGGYLKGVHNVDAEKIVESIIKTHKDLGILTFSPKIRVAAQLFWNTLSNKEREKLMNIIKVSKSIHTSFPTAKQEEWAIQEIEKVWNASEVFYTNENSKSIASYLYREFSIHLQFTVSEQAFSLKEDFVKYLKTQKKYHLFELELSNELFSLDEHFYLIQNWLTAFLTTDIGRNHDSRYMDETACLLLFPNHEFVIHHASDTIQVEELKGIHTTIFEQKLSIQYHDFINELEKYTQTIVPKYLELQMIKEQLISDYKQELKIQEFEPKVLSSFVRNRLINEVYFPLIGANLSKQIGALGEHQRTARMGMLLLISPPGYGKTTLMEYLAKVMGLHFVKINGPTIGHSITSIDPSEARTSGAREELKKINLAMEMADNVMLYIDDIQHCNPEFLQKFISLADGQRKMDGIFEGNSKTYDLRGHRFCIVMAGNPYTESGEKFKIPDMLANRADVYNLGDVIGNTAHLFHLSLIENAIQENPYLQKIANKNLDDFYRLIEYTELHNDELPDIIGNYTKQDLDEGIAVLKNVIKVRDIVIKVNQHYIASAAMKDAYRLEPPFKLQGSYRNMNRLVNRIVPLMNDEELMTLVISHYESESQTLTSDAEANLLKLKEIAGVLTANEKERWEDIKSLFVKNNQFAGIENIDTTGKVLIQLNEFNHQLKNIVNAIEKK